MTHLWQNVTRLVEVDLDDGKSALPSNRNNPSTPLRARAWEARRATGGDGSEDTAADEEREKLIKKS